MRTASSNHIDPAAEQPRETLFQVDDAADMIQSAPGEVFRQPNHNVQIGIRTRFTPGATEPNRDTLKTPAALSTPDAARRDS